jgi:hypothetical protein
MPYLTQKIALSIAVIAPLSMSLLAVTHAGPFGVGGGGGFGGAGGISSQAVPGGGFGQGASVIGDGMGGFKMYSPSGTSRYIGNSSAPGKVYHPDGSSSVVIPDGQGNLDIYGPQGTHKFFGNSTTPKVDPK